MLLFCNCLALGFSPPTYQKKEKKKKDMNEILSHFLRGVLWVVIYYKGYNGLGFLVGFSLGFLVVFGSHRLFLLRSMCALSWVCRIVVGI